MNIKDFRIETNEKCTRVFYDGLCQMEMLNVQDILTEMFNKLFIENEAIKYKEMKILKEFKIKITDCHKLVYFDNKLVLKTHNYSFIEQTIAELFEKFLENKNNYKGYKLDINDDIDIDDIKHDLRFNNTDEALHKMRLYIQTMSTTNDTVTFTINKVI